MHALAEWEDLSKLADETWCRADKLVKKRMAPLAAAGAWHLGKWKAMEDYISAIPEHTVRPPREIQTRRVILITISFFRSTARFSGPFSTCMRRSLMWRC